MGWNISSGDDIFSGSVTGNLELTGKQIAWMKSLSCPFDVQVRRPCGPQPFILRDKVVVEDGDDLTIELTPEEANDLARWLENND